MCCNTIYAFSILPIYIHIQHACSRVCGHHGQVCILTSSFICFISGISILLLSIAQLSWHAFSGDRVHTITCAAWMTLHVNSLQLMQSRTLRQYRRLSKTAIHDQWRYFLSAITQPGQLHVCVCTCTCACVCGCAHASAHGWCMRQRGHSWKWTEHIYQAHWSSMMWSTAVEYGSADMNGKSPEFT